MESRPPMATLASHSHGHGGRTPLLTMHYRLFKFFLCTHKPTTDNNAAAMDFNIILVFSCVQ